MRHVQRLAHIVVFALTVHVWHVVTSDRFLDAYADVAMDKVATVALRSFHIAAE